MAKRTDSGLYPLQHDIVDCSADRHRGVDGIGDVRGGTRSTEARGEDDVFEDLRDESVLRLRGDLVAAVLVSTRYTGE